jgi:hypothetical protein
VPTAAARVEKELRSEKLDHLHQVTPVPDPDARWLRFGSEFKVEEERS